MSNQDFVYFNWGTHDNPTNPYYGLVSPTADKIYVVSEDYQELKSIQLLLLSSKQLSTATLSAVPNYKHGIIDNSVCLNWMISSPWGQQSILGLAGDFKSRRSDALVESSHPTSQDIELQNNIMFLQVLIREVGNFFDREINDQIDNRHNRALRNFVELLMPNDKDILQVIDFEIQLVDQYKQNINEIKNNFMRTLAGLNYTQQHSEIHESITKIISNMHSTNDIEQSFKQFLKNLVIP